MIINVTQEHIDRGVPDCPDICPIALALIEQTSCKEWYVVGKYAAAYLNTNFLRAVNYKLPDVCGTFVREFDQKKAALPFSFELEFNNDI